MFRQALSQCGSGGAVSRGASAAARASRAAHQRRGYLQPKAEPPKEVTAAEAVAAIPSGARVYVHGAACTPHRLLDALSARSELRNVELVHMHLEGGDPVRGQQGEAGRRFFHNNLFMGHNVRAAVAAGAGSYVPTFLSDIGKLMRSGAVTPDVALLQVSPPDRHGYVTLGCEVAAAYAAAETAKLMIAMVNPNMPKTRGGSFVPLRAFDYVVPNAADPLSEAAPGAINDVNRAIGNHIAGLVVDGATLQMGIGAIPNAVLAALTNHRHLGVHTEMFSDGLIPLLRSGVVDNSRKRYMPGRTVTSFCVGSRALYDFVDDNPSVIFQEAAITNDPVVIAQNPRVTAINSAVEVDLTGQVVADSVGTYMLSGVGGQVDFERGAAISAGGVPIIALPSTAKDGSSKIVGMIKPGAGVVTSRAHVHYVVTEHGVANMFGKNLHQRARALIGIAAPQHRAELERGAFERFNIATWRD